MNINVARESEAIAAKIGAAIDAADVQLHLQQHTSLHPDRPVPRRAGLRGLGGLILGNSLYWRVHALRASGVIIGVTAKNGMYAPVYRYTLPDAQTHEAQSDTSSGTTRGTETG
jgi:hypothetical protein